MTSHSTSSAKLPEHADVAIIGAGPAGASAAAILARRGWNVCVIEREQFPRFVIGESLLPRAMDLLEASGLLPDVQAEGFIEKRGALFFRGEDECRFDFSEQFTCGWDYTYHVPRDRFDQILADGAAAAGASIIYRSTVEDVKFSPEPVLTVRDAEGATREISSRFVMDASGFGRVLPRLLKLAKPSGIPDRVSLFTHVTGDIRPEGIEEGRIWICIHPGGGWLWIIPFSNGRTSVGVVGDPEFFENFPGDPSARLRAIIDSEPNAARRLANMEILFEPKLNQSYSVSVDRMHGPGYCLMGNSTEFLDPIFSSGVTLAIESAHLAAELLDRQLRGEAVDWQEDYDAHMRQGFETFRAFIEGWYDGSLASVLFSKNPNQSFKNQICSVLAGYVWDSSNPFASEPDRRLKQLVRLVGQLSAR